MLVGPMFGFKLKLSFASSSRLNYLASQFENVPNCLTRPCGRADKDIFGGSDFILKLDTHQPLHSHYQKYHFLGGGGKHRVHFLVDLVTISRFDSSNSKSIFCHCELSHPFSSSGFLFYSRHCRYMQTDDVLFLLFVAF